MQGEVVALQFTSILKDRGQTHFQLQPMGWMTKWFPALLIPQE